MTTGCKTLFVNIVCKSLGVTVVKLFKLYASEFVLVCKRSTVVKINSILTVIVVQICGVVLSHGILDPWAERWFQSSTVHWKLEGLIMWSTVAIQHDTNNDSNNDNENHHNSHYFPSWDRLLGRHRRRHGFWSKRKKRLSKPRRKSSLFEILTTVQKIVKGTYFYCHHSIYCPRLPKQTQLTFLCPTLL